MSKPCYDPDKWLCCAAVRGYPFKRVSQMTIEELQQTLCHQLANDWFDMDVRAKATHEPERASRCHPSTAS